MAPFEPPARCAATPRAGTRLAGRRCPPMLKLAGVFLVIMIIAGVLGFVVDVAGFAAKIAFFVCLVGLVGSLAARALNRR